MSQNKSGVRDVLVTALAPVVWGSTYVVITEFLPAGYPLTIAMLRALPAGLILLALVRRLPPLAWVLKIFILGALNFTILWSLLFVSAYRLPGGIAATIVSMQALIVIVFARMAFGTPIRLVAAAAAGLGVFGVGLLVLTPTETIDPLGVFAGLGGACAMAAGTVLSRKWRPPVSLLTFTAWQLTAGGLLLLPLAITLEPHLPALSVKNTIGLVYLGLLGAAVTYLVWLRGVERMDPSTISALGFLTPLTAATIGWAALNQALTPAQIGGAALVLGAVWVSQTYANANAKMGRPRVAIRDA